MTRKTLRTDEQAVSPVIGVILMVAITVILAAVIGTMVMGLGQNTVSQQATASVSVSGNTATLSSLASGAEGVKCAGENLDANTDDGGSNTTVVGNTVECGDDVNSIVAYSHDENVENATVYTFDS